MNRTLSLNSIQRSNITKDQTIEIKFLVKHNKYKIRNYQNYYIYKINISSNVLLDQLIEHFESFVFHYLTDFN